MAELLPITDSGETPHPVSKQPLPITNQPPLPTTHQSPFPTHQPPLPTTHQPPLSITHQPPLPTAQPPLPTAQPPLPTTQPPLPTTQPPLPITQPPLPITQPPLPITQPPLPITQPPLPTTQPPLPTMQPHSTTQPPTNALPQPTRKRGKYLPEEDLIMVREVAAAGAHVAKYGETRDKFLQAANKVNQNPHMRQKVTWKAVQDRYKRLQDDFDTDDLRNHNLSGVGGGEMGDLCQSLSMMREERDSFVKEKESDKSAKSKRDEEKERMGRRFVEMALKRKGSREGSATEQGNESPPGEETNEDQSESARNGSARKTKRRKTGLEDMTVGLEAFGAHLKDADMARIDWDREQLLFAKEKHEKERIQRQEEREERRRERQDTQKFELEKFKMMFDAFKELRKE